CYQLSQANSEHSRHWFFKGRMVIDGEIMTKTLMQIIKSTLETNPSNSIIAFKDNSGAIKGYSIYTIYPDSDAGGFSFKSRKRIYHIIFTAETHNFPSGVAPFPGAETGTGGRIRDVEATGRGGLVVAGTAGYATGNLNMPGYYIPGENDSLVYPDNLASPLKIMIEESNGASDYGNKFGEPLIQGFARTFGAVLVDGQRREWIKPIMFTGGVGQIDDSHINKRSPENEMLIIQVGGPAYRIGMGGGSASSMIQGENLQELDFNAVQRGNAEMEQKLNRVVRACIEMGDENPVLSIHDQGAGGPCNVLTEIVDPAGGRINIRQINVGDKTMSVAEIWVAEYQERNAFLIYKKDIEIFKNICSREKVNCEVLGKIAGDGRIVVYDSIDSSKPVDLELEKILGHMPEKKFEFDRADKQLKELQIPPKLSLREAVINVFKLPSVGSKGFLVRKVDRSVTGLIAQQQCCGPLHLPVSDVSVIAQSHFGVTGAAVSIGEQPLKLLVNAAAGARMAVCESLTNLVWAKVSSLCHVKCSVNWMWPAKLPGEGAELWDAANALAGVMKKLSIAADGGKDSVSMAAQVENNVIKCPPQVVVSAYVTVPDINKVITPDIKKPGCSSLLLIDIAEGKRRLGASAFAQCLGQIGNDTPDLDKPDILKNAFEAVQEMIEKDYLLAGHDISDGGLITAVAEMLMPAGCGASIYTGNDIFSELFSEEAGLLIEYENSKHQNIEKILKKYNLTSRKLGNTISEKKLIIKNNEKIIEEFGTDELICWWESTSDELEKFQQNPDFTKMQRKSHIRGNPRYLLSFCPEATDEAIIKSLKKPKVAIVREEGSNGDREMASAFFMAGFEVWDVTMSDLLKGAISLDEFKGAAFVGGFSYADVLDSAKGWAAIIRFNKRLSEMFENFYKRDDTFSLGVCNGCQLMSLLGWVPYKGIEEKEQPRFIANPSGRFESRWSTVKIIESPSIMLKGMEGSILGIWIAHREGYLKCGESLLNKIIELKLAPVAYLDDKNRQTEKYPYNPNSSPKGITALCSPDGRHLAMMPHPERAFVLWQWPWMPGKWRKELAASPWLKMFQNARHWCQEFK
ncbi:MAG: phosphoribosylformylglycinamidine synthase, partial [Actinobacteria bacterium]|nr:phosphoribosylformylglycinamidine synthase [Actinomycetota bacterium]